MPLRPFHLVALLAQFAGAQAPDSAARASGAIVRGIVRDSVGRTTLAGATVQLVAADSLARLGRLAVSDSFGRFALSDIPVGRYTLGFFHPILDSLGVDSPLREVFVDGGRPVSADLATPSPARLRAAICGPRSGWEAGAVVVGVVRDARDGEPMEGVIVAGEWLEYSFRADGVARRIPRVVVATAANGWFAMCNVPSGGTMVITASRGADSTDVIEVPVSTDGFLRRELYLGPARTIVIGDTTRSDSLAPPPRRLHIGDGRLTGSVHTVEGRPLDGARIGITGGPQTLSNERGEWVLVDAPIGTRMLEVRSVGYYPDRRRVDVIAGVPPIRVTLSTLKSVLDTVRVTASRLRAHHGTGFEERRRGSGVGRFLTAQDIARRQPMVTSDLFRMVPSLSLGGAKGGIGNRIFMKSGFGAPCSPAIVIDGQYIGGISLPGLVRDPLSADDIDIAVTPDRIAGMEVYTESAVPPQFQQGLSGCGSIVIWTK